MATTIGEVLTQYEADATDADAKAKAAIEADKAASDAAAKKEATTRTTAVDLHATGAIFVQLPDGTFKVYSSADGVAVAVLVPHPASTVIPDPTPAPAV